PFGNPDRVLGHQALVAGPGGPQLRDQVSRGRVGVGIGRDLGLQQQCQDEHGSLTTGQVLGFQVEPGLSHRISFIRAAPATLPFAEPPVTHVPVLVRTILLLTLSNIFMTFAWYAHLKELNQKPWVVAALLSWGVALFEYLLQVPANRIGYTEYSVAQLKILQEVIALSVFVP